MIGLTNNEFYGLVAGWILAVLLLLFNTLLIKFTPAVVFFKAWMSKSVVAWVKFRTGLGEFRIAKSEDPGSVDVKDLGFVQLVEGSQVLERNSKVPVYDVFAEYGASIPKEYPAIIQELREEGFVVNSFRDYAHLVKLAGNDVYASQHLAEIKDEVLRKETEERIKVLKEMEITIKPYKTYKVHELAFMFPNNMTPGYVDAKVTNAVLRKVNKMKGHQQILIYGAFAILILVIAAVIVIKTLKTPSVPPITVSCAQAGLNAVNSTLGL